MTKKLLWTAFILIVIYAGLHIERETSPAHAATEYHILQINANESTLRSLLGHNQIAITADSVAENYRALCYKDGDSLFYILLTDSNDAVIKDFTVFSVADIGTLHNVDTVGGTAAEFTRLHITTIYVSSSIEGVGGPLQLDDTVRVGAGAVYLRSPGGGNLEINSTDAMKIWSTANDGTIEIEASTGNIIIDANGGAATDPTIDLQAVLVKATAGTLYSTGSIEADDFLALGYDTQTLSTNAITASKSFHKVDTEAAAILDTLSTINGGYDNCILILRTVDDGRDVFIDDAAGNLDIAGDFTLTDEDDVIMLIQYAGGAGWLEVSRSNNN